MAELYDVILAHAKTEAEASDFAQVATIINTASEAKRDATPWKLGDLINVLGPVEATLVANTIKTEAATNPLYESAWTALSTTGLRLDEDWRQGMVDGLAVAGSWPEATRDAVKELGVKWHTPAYLYGFITPPTETECSNAWTQYVFEQEYISGMVAVEAAIPSGRTTTVAALRALADSLEGS